MAEARWMKPQSLPPHSSLSTWGQPTFIRSYFVHTGLHLGKTLPGSRDDARTGDKGPRPAKVKLRLGLVQVITTAQAESVSVRLVRVAHAAEATEVEMELGGRRRLARHLPVAHPGHNYLVRQPKKSLKPFSRGPATYRVRDNARLSQTPTIPKIPKIPKIPEESLVSDTGQSLVRLPARDTEASQSTAIHNDCGQQGRAVNPARIGSGLPFPDPSLLELRCILRSQALVAAIAA
ncbi:hypothetical protein QBC36DRAFT_315318 [Triangularia setosa]|uniref:Uncharacterized protein n=1 Tax=Triangularia setosa TaxID=2587417 RepID=A0AAN6VY39_9PEZI|nr:hypothetical protein QBC36DRAFT_315318 [Podospora setosa]